MAELDASTRATRLEVVEYDARGRVVARGIDESRARAKANASWKPIRLVVEIDAVRGLPRDAARAHVVVRGIARAKRAHARGRRH
jgi:hypothetical protein